MKISAQTQKNKILTTSKMNKITLSKPQLKRVKGGSDSIIVEELIIS